MLLRTNSELVRGVITTLEKDKPTNLERVVFVLNAEPPVVRCIQEPHLKFLSTVGEEFVIQCLESSDDAGQKVEHLFPVIGCIVEKNC